MKTFVVALPLFDDNMAVFAYRLCAQNGEKLFGTAQDFHEMGEVLLSPALDLVDQVGIEPFTGGKKLFADVNQYHMMLGIPASLDLDPASLVCVLPKTTPCEEVVLQKCMEYKQLGYSFAVENLAYSEEYKPLFDLCDYIFYDTAHVNFKDHIVDIKRAYPDKMLVINNVPDQKAYEQYKTIPNAIFAGKFYNQPLTAGKSDIAPVKANALQLMRIVNEDEDFDLTPIVQSVERDPSLSISLLRFINSPAVGVRQQIDSIRSAVAILGQKEIKKWVTVAISIQLAEDRPNELTKLSLVRAKFAENLAKPYSMVMQNPSLFLSGLFSLLDVILEKPMAEAVDEVALDDRVKQCLVQRKGSLFRVMELIYGYELANWDRVAINMIRNNVDVQQINKAYVDALIWYKKLLEDI